MNKQEYLDELLNDAKEWIDENHEYYDSFNRLWDEMEMQITGNDNGSYYCDSHKAEQAIAEAMWDESVVDCVRELGFNGIPTNTGPEAVDVIIRIALLGDLQSEIKEYYEETIEEE